MMSILQAVLIKPHPTFLDANNSACIIMITLLDRLYADSKVFYFACMQVCVSSIEVPDHVHITIEEDKCLVDT